MNQQVDRTLQEVYTSLPAEAVLEAAFRFFTGASGIYAAFPEKEGAGWCVYRGQGGEEIALAAQLAAGGVTRVSGSSYMFDQQVASFLSSLPVASPEAAPVLLDGTGLPQPAPAP